MRTLKSFLIGLIIGAVIAASAHLIAQFAQDSKQLLTGNEPTMITGDY